MDFSFTPEQDELRRAVRDLAERRIGSAKVRAAMATGGNDGELWTTACSQLGLAGLAVPESAGGSGASWVEVGIVLEELGASLAPIALLPHVVAASVIPASMHGLAELAAGTKVAAVALGSGVTSAGAALVGRAEHVLHGATADVFVVSAADVDGEALFLVHGEVGREELIPVDQTRAQATLTFEGSAAHRIGGQEAVDRARDILRVAIALESVGAASRCLEMTVDYLKTRVQFGKVLGAFQALRHRAADCAVALEGATATARYASWVIDGDPAELPIVAPIAKALCTQTYRDIAAEMIQLHGGIGFTWVHDAHLYFKRATANLLLGGDPAAERRVLASRVDALASSLAPS